MLRRFQHDRRGAAAVVTALSGVAVIGFAGLAIDTGAVYLESRRLQGTADLAAIAAMQSPNNAQQLADATMRANRWPEHTRAHVVRGAYVADREIAPARRFTANAPNANAVRVELTSQAPLFFGRLFIPDGRIHITRRATAAQSRLASFQIGSRLLALRGGVANDVLSALAGGRVELSVMDYNALLSADVDLFSYMDALRTRLELDAATFDQTLATRMETPEALDALADVLAVQDRNAERAVRRMAQNARGRIDGMDQLIDLGPYGAQDHAMQSGATRVQVSAMELASAILQLAGGDRQVRLELDADLPGLADTTAWLAIGERPNNSPWLAITDDDNVIVRTAQMRLYVEANVRPLGGAIAQVRVPILVELASAQARLADITCGIDASDRSVTLEVAPSVGSLTLGEINVARLDNFRSPLNADPARLVRVGAIRVDGESRIDAGGAVWSNVTFDDDDISNGTVKHVATRDVARTTVSSLVGQANLTVRVGGLGVGTQAVTGSVRGALTAAAAPLDQLVNGLSDLLGLRLGEADVRVNGVRCGGAALVA